MIRKAFPEPPLARSLGRRGIQRPSYLMPCHTTGQVLRVESRLERQIALALDVDPRVTSIASQPFSIRLDSGELFQTQSLARKSVGDVDDDFRKGLIYTPDLLVELAGGRHALVECKREEQALLMHVELERIRSVLTHQGFDFRLFTDTDVACPGLEANLIRIRDAATYRQQSDAVVDFSAIEAIQAPDGHFTLEIALAVVDQATLLMAIAAGVLAVDLRGGPLSKETRATLSHGELSHLQVLELGE